MTRDERHAQAAEAANTILHHLFRIRGTRHRPPNADEAAKAVHTLMEMSVCEGEA